MRETSSNTKNNKDLVDEGVMRGSHSAYRIYMVLICNLALTYWASVSSSSSSLLLSLLVVVLMS